MSYLTALTRSLRELLATNDSTGIVTPGTVAVAPNGLVKANVPDPIDAITSAIARKHPVTLVHGRAGTGKTTLLRRLIKETKLNYVVVAPTGVKV